MRHQKLTRIVTFHCSSYSCCSTALQLQQCQRDSIKRHLLTYTLGIPGSLLVLGDANKVKNVRAACTGTAPGSKLLHESSQERSSCYWGVTNLICAWHAGGGPPQTLGSRRACGPCTQTTKTVRALERSSTGASKKTSPPYLFTDG